MDNRAGCRAGLAALLIAAVALAGPAGAATQFDPEAVAGFAAQMAERHGWAEDELLQTLAQARRSESILRAIARPAERKPWHEYGPIFVTGARAEAGARFWRDNAETLARAERDYGVPPAIVTAIIGVETYFGRNTGSHRVLDALATLGFAYPPRSRFFTSELEHFLLLCRAQSLNPTALVGSYAGAMGLPQFMPSSYRAYAVDYDQDGLIDIWDNPVDAIGSVASYLAEHGWRRGGAIAHRVIAGGARLAEHVDAGLKPELPLAELEGLALEIAGSPPPGALVDVVALEQAEGMEYWLGYQNFYTITRYNHSRMYAMAVYQLAQAIDQRMAQARQ